MARRTVIYDDFSKGAYGRMGDRNPGKGYWNGTNMILYKTGEIGVRPGLKNIGVTGLTTGAVWALDNADISMGATQRVWFGQSTKVRSFDAGVATPAVASSAATLSAAPTSQMPTIATGDNGYFAHDNTGTTGGIWRVSNAATPVLTQMKDFDTKDGGKGLAIFGERMFAHAGLSTQLNRLFYSAAADFTSWDLTNDWVDIGTEARIRGIYAQRNHLLVCKDEGIYVVTGTPDIDLTVRQVSNLPGPPAAYAGNISPVDGVLWYTHPTGHFPCTFNGAYGAELDHLVFPDMDTLAGTHRPLFFKFRDRSGICILSDDTVDGALTRINGAWSTQEWGVDVDNFGAQIHHMTSMEDVHTTSTLILTDGGGAAANPIFWAWSPLTDRPGKESAKGGHDWEKAGDNSTTQVSGSVTFPEWFSDEGSDVLVRSVSVQFRKWDTGGASTNNFTCTVTAINPYGGGDNASASQSWNEVGTSASQDGSRDEVTFHFGDQGIGNGFQLAFTACRGIAIRRILVGVETQPRRW